MSILMIDENVQAAIIKACALARANPKQITDKEKLALMALKNLPDGATITLADRPPDWKSGASRHGVLIPFGFRAMISYEVQPEPLGLSAHLSLSAARGRIPNEFALEMVAKAFGMLNEGYPRRVWLEEFEPGWHAINMVEPIEWKKP